MRDKVFDNFRKVKVVPKQLSKFIMACTKLVATVLLTTLVTALIEEDDNIPCISSNGSWSIDVDDIYGTVFRKIIGVSNDRFI